MKKKLLALAVAGAFVAPVAMADTANVTVYGQANASFDMVNNGRTASNTGTRNNKVSSNASRLGVKGSEDLGGGLNAIFQIESAIGVDNAATSALANRDTYVGLSGEGFGSLVLGIKDSPYKASTRKLDAFIDTIADNRSLMGFGSTQASFDGRTSDSVTYTSPNLGGVTVAVQYGAKAETALGDQRKGSQWSLSAVYDAAPFYASVANERKSTTNASMYATQAREQAYKLGGAYKVEQFEADVVFERVTETAANTATTAFSDNIGHKAVYLGGKFNISSSDAVKLAFTKKFNQNMDGRASRFDTSATQMSIGFDHSLSKRTAVYALFTKLNNKSAANYTLGNAGFSTGGTAPNGVGSDPSAVALGVKHNF